MLPATQYAPVSLAQGTGLAPLGTMRQNKHPPERAELVLDLLSLRVKSPVLWVSGLSNHLWAPRRLVSWGHCPSLSYLSGSCFNFVGKQEAKSLAGLGVALAFHNDEFLLFCSSVPKMKGVTQTDWKWNWQHLGSGVFLGREPKLSPSLGRITSLIRYF